MSVYDGLTFAPMLITNVFETMKASNVWYDKVHLKPGDAKIPYLSQTLSGNGVSGIVADQGSAPEPGNCITITLKTQSTFYQPVPFYTAQNFLIFRHGLLNKDSGLALVSILRNALTKFSWGYGVSMARLRKTRIMVPVITGKEGQQLVDWEGLTSLGEALFAKAVTRTLNARTTDLTNNDTPPKLRYASMLMNDLFIQHRGKAGTRDDKGTVPYIVAASRNNSQSGFVKDKALFPGKWLAIVNTGAGGVGYCTYQPVPFWASNNVTALEPRNSEAAEDALLFLTTCVRFQTFGKYNYGNIANMQRIKRQRIMVPVTTDNNGEQVVDWDGMTAYGRVLRARAEQAMAVGLDGM